MEKFVITGVVITKNEEKTIGNRIKELNFCKQILVIDQGSADKTRSIAEDLGAKVYQCKSNSFSDRRNFALEKASFDWVFYLDTDEILSEELKNEIIENIKTKTYLGFYIKRKDIFFDKLLSGGEQGGTKLVRLGRKNKGNWIRNVHEEWIIDGKIGQLKNPLIHKQPHSLMLYFEKINIYSSMHARFKYDEGKKASFWKIIYYPVLKFINNYVFKSGFRDGDYGFLAAMLMSLHSFLSWSKLWLLQKR